MQCQRLHSADDYLKPRFIHSKPYFIHLLMFHSLETRAGLSEALALFTSNGLGTISKQVTIGKCGIVLTLPEKEKKKRT